MFYSQLLTLERSFSVELLDKADCYFSGLSADDSVLALADFVGGSPLTTAATVLEESG